MKRALKMTLGYLGATLQRYTPLKFSGNSFEDTFNYLPLNDMLATSGQPTEQQFRSIQQAGFTTVINLAPQGLIENSLKSESDLLGQLGIRYVHIPVNYKNPTASDFDKFVTAVQSASNEKTWVHCAVNGRVSAFIYRYRTQVLGESPAVAREDLEKIWQPVGVWKRFITDDSRNSGGED